MSDDDDDRKFEPTMSAEAFDRLWEVQGLKWRVDDHFRMCVGSGLLLKHGTFVNKLHNLLRDFLVVGDHRTCPDHTDPPACNWLNVL